MSDYECCASGSCEVCRRRAILSLEVIARMLFRAHAADVPQIVILCHLGRPRRSPAPTDTTARILIETDSCQ